MISLIEIEIKVITVKIHHPELNTSAKANIPRFPFHWHGCLNELMELLCSLWYNGNIRNKHGKIPSFTSYVKACEMLFNVKLPNPFNKRSQLADRKKNLTPLLDKLKNVFIENISKIGG